MTVAALVEFVDGGLSPQSARSVEVAAGMGPVRAICIGRPSAAALVELARRGAVDVLPLVPGATGAGDTLGSELPVDTGALAVSLHALLADPGIRALIAPPTPGLRELLGRLAVRTSAPLVGGVVDVRDRGAVLEIVASTDGGLRESVLVVAGDSCPLLLVSAVPARDLPPASEGTMPSPVGGRLVGATDEFSRASGIAVAPQPRAVELVAFEPTAGTPSTGLSEARVVVAGGRGLGSAEALDVLRRWAASVGAAFGTSRAPVEAGWAGFEELIGQTGTVVRPDLYLAFGVSGAPQHLAGMRGARTVVSVNIDESAPLASEADVVITADVREILEALRAAG